MGRKTPADKLREARDMLRAGFTFSEIEKALGISRGTVRGQALLLERFEGFDTKAAASAAHAEAASRDSVQHKQRAALGREYDPEALDLVSIFSTPRTPRQLRRFMGGDDG